MLKIECLGVVFHGKLLFAKWLDRIYLYRIRNDLLPVLELKNKLYLITYCVAFFCSCSCFCFCQKALQPGRFDCRQVQVTLVFGEGRPVTGDWKPMASVT